MLALRILPSLSPHFLCRSFHPSKPFFCLLSSSLPSPVNVKASDPKAPLVDYLIDTFKFSETEALAFSNLRKKRVSTKRLQSLREYFQKLGFSDVQIQSAVRVAPNILFADISKTLQPKIEFFQKLGLVGNDLGCFIAKNAVVLSFSLQRKIGPCVAILRKLLPDDVDNKDLILVLRRYSRILGRDPGSVLLENANFLQSCGILGPHLSMLLKRHPYVFCRTGSSLRALVTKVLDMGFSINSRMLVHGLITLSAVSNSLIRRKHDLFLSFGFSEDECMTMFRKSPTLLRTSEKKLRFGIEFFMNTMNVNKSELLSNSSCLMMSMRNRVIPRYKVMQILTSKKLLKKDSNLRHIMIPTEEAFLDKFVYIFADDADELLAAYESSSPSALELDNVI